MKNKKPKEPEGPNEGDVTVTIVLGGGVVQRFRGRLREHTLRLGEYPVRYNTYHLAMTKWEMGTLEPVLQPPAPLDPSWDEGVSIEKLTREQLESLTEHLRQEGARGMR